MDKAVAIGLAVAASAVVLVAAYTELAAPAPALLPSYVARRSAPVRRPNLQRMIDVRGSSLARPPVTRFFEDTIASPVAVHDANHSGLCVVDDRVTIVSYDAWIDFASRAITEALVDGARGADGVLIHVMRRALPKYKWPPNPKSAMSKQWPQMVQVVAEHLYVAPEPEPQRTTNRLRLI